MEKALRYTSIKIPVSPPVFQKMSSIRRSKLEPTGDRSRPDGRCKKHPKHQQSSGVCSLCLSERLSQILAASSRGAPSARGHCSSSSPSSLSSNYSSSSASSLSSPMHRHRGKGSLSFLSSGKNVLTKSRSIAFLSRTRGNKERSDEKKKGGLLSKFLRPRNERTEEKLAHSRTMRERVIVTN